MTELYYYFLTHFSAFVIASGLLGALIGSFLNVVIYRLPVMMERAWQDELAHAGASQNSSDAAHTTEAPHATQAPRERFDLISPRSRCGQCGHMITALENIPLISWLALGRKCSACKAPISVRYPLVELLTALLFAAAAAHFGVSVQAASAMALCASLVALTGIDLDTQLLPDQITLPLMWLGLLLNLGGLFTPLPDAVIGAVAGYLTLWGIYWAFKLITGREGMGYGDFKLLAALGAWFGWAALPMLLLISSLVGAVIGIVMLTMQGKDRQTAIAFGPYLAIAGLIMLFFGSRLQLGALVL